jgi:O-antigen/teichoic acid export membrane protein
VTPSTVRSRLRERAREGVRRLPGAQDDAGQDTRRYGRTASLLTVGIGASGLVTYLYFALASHALSKVAYGEIVVVWSAVFVTVITLYRPVEQLLSRTIAERQAHDQAIAQPMRVAATIQLGLAVVFAVVVLAARGPIQDSLLSGKELLYWVLVAAVLAYAASFFARGFLAGTRRFGLYGAVLLAESSSRIMFALAVTVGIASGQSVIALGIIAGPCFSLIVLPAAFSRRAARRARSAPRDDEGPRGDEPEFTLAHGGGFAAAVLLIMFSEQTFMNAGPLLIRATEGAAAAGFIFNVIMVARAPLVLFQAVATSLLPHLTRLRSRQAGAGDRAFQLSIRATLGAVAAFAGFTALVILIAGPDLMQLAFGKKFSYDRVGLLIVAAGMGLYLSAVTLNQAALAKGQARVAAACYVVCAAAFVGFALLPVMDEFRRVEVGFAGATGLLCGLLYALYRRPRGRPEDVVRPDSPEELEARLAAADEAS